MLIGVISGCMSGFRLIMNTIKKMDKKKEENLQKQENTFVLPKRESRIFKNKDE